MTFSHLRQELSQTAQHFCFAKPRIARRQAKHLIRARIYLAEHDISAVAVGSKFEYKRTTGSILGMQS
jgi:hypothetical protein